MIKFIPKDCDWIKRLWPCNKWGIMGHLEWAPQHFSCPRFFFNTRMGLYFHSQKIPKWNSRRLAMLDKFYISKQSRIDLHHKAYYIQRNMVGLDHFPIQMKISIGNSDVRASHFKWNVTYLQGKIMDLHNKTGAGLPTQTSLFSKLRVISRLYRKVSKSKATKLKPNTRAKLGIVTANLHEFL